MPFGTTGSTNYKNQVLDFAFRPGASPTRPTALYAALSTASGSSTEAQVVAGEVSGEARQPVTFGAAANGQDSDTAVVNFANEPAGTENWVMFWDAASGGSLVAYGPLAASVTNVSGATITFAVGQLTNTTS